MKPTQTIEQTEVILCNLLALRDALTDDFRIEHDDVVVPLQTTVNLLRMAQGAVQENGAYS